MSITNFNLIETGKEFPNREISLRNMRYRIQETRFSGRYNDNSYLIVQSSTGTQKKLPWKTLKINQFKLYVNKMDSLVFNRDPIIKSGNVQRDKEIMDLVERTEWVKTVRKAFRNLEIYGDSYIKTYKHGASAFSPLHAFKVVDRSDKDKVKAYVLYENIVNDDNDITHIRFEVHLKGKVYERVYVYNNQQIGESVRYVYKGRTIGKGGNWYDTNVDEFMVQLLSIDTDQDGYGASPFEDFSSQVHELERRQTLESKILDSHSEPMLVLGVGCLVENEETGRVETIDVLGNILEIPNGGQVPQYVTWDGKLDSNENMIDLLYNEIYQLSELGKVYMTGEYGGNISEETLSNLMKSSIDKGNRHIWDMYYDIRKSLFVLCRLNDIDVKLEELNIIFEVGQSESVSKIADIINSRVKEGTLSLETALQKYEGLDKEQAKEEIERIRKEKNNV